MKKILSIVAILSLVFSPVTPAVAAVQDIGAGTTEVAPGTGQVDGVNFTANGIGTLIDGQPLNSNGTNKDAATTATDGTGTLTFFGSSVVKGDVGVNSSKRLNALNIDGGVGKTVSFIKDTGDLAHAIIATSLRFGSVATSDATVSMADGMSLTAAVATFTNSTGTLNFLGASTIDGQVGGAGAYLKAINVTTASDFVVFKNDVFVNGVQFGNQGTNPDSEITFNSNAYIGQGGVSDGIHA